jgi:hypothetical protein
MLFSHVETVSPDEGEEVDAFTFLYHLMLLQLPHTWEVDACNT